MTFSIIQLNYDGATVGKERENPMENKILVETSARHIHLSEEHINILFGEGHQLTVKKMLRNWVIVYIGNFIGCAALALMWQHSGLLSSGADMLGAMTVKIAAGKCNLEFLPAFLMGILCNWLVCLGVWMATGAEGFAGKIVGMFFPIWIFVTSGFEHCVANMYYVPAGIFAKVNETYVQLSGVSEAALQNLTWAGFFVNNLIPVTLGNIIGGGVCVGLAYWVAYKKA